MSKVYIVTGGDGGRCRCGHRSKRGEKYVLIEGEKGSWTLCGMCGDKNKMRGQKVTAEEMRRMWARNEPMFREMVTV